MELNRFYSFALIVLSLIFGYLAYLVMKPFLIPIMWAVVMAILFYPLYAFLGKYIKWKAIASLLTLVVIVLLIIGPFSYMIISLGAELSQLSSQIEETKIDELIRTFERHYLVAGFLEALQKTFGIREIDLVKIFQTNLSTISAAILELISISVKNAAVAAINLILMIFSLFFLLKDGPDFIQKINGYLPFPEVHRERLTSKIKDMVISTIYGGVTIGICQGIAGGIAFYLLGISSPVFWGMMILFMSFVPALGTFSIWAPAALILILQGHVLKGVILVFIGIFIISMIDNVLKPLIIGSRTKMHTLIIFFSILGGISLFGLIGLIMGPLIIVISISIFEIFRHIEEEYVIIETPGKKD
ncbi:MAG: AI-2E family transporter [bacterium]